jgi:predicted membrane channel-forming protein YqfA (hemolysin III family)
MKVFKVNLDKLSAGMSLLCMAHCVILPVFLSTFTLAGIEIVENLTLEILMLLGGIIAGTLAIRKGMRKHGLWHVLILFVLGMFFMIVANLPELQKAEVILKLFGAVLVINAHIINYRLSRCRPAIK